MCKKNNIRNALLRFAGNIRRLSSPAIHCATKMTEVAQVAAVVGHDVDDVTNESELNTSDAENKEEDGAEVDGDDAEAEEGSEDASRPEDKEPLNADGEESNQADESRVNGVNHEENSEALSGGEQDTETKEDEDADAREGLSISDLQLKKEVSEEMKADQWWDPSLVDRGLPRPCG